MVIEDATVSATVDIVEEVAEIVVGGLATTVGGERGTHYIGKVTGDFVKFDRSGRTMKVYADPLTDVSFLSATWGTPEDIEMCFSGRLEPVTAP